MNVKRIAVLGCGAMGSIYAALFARAGYDVIAVDANAEHVDAINANGLRVSGASGDNTVRIRAYTSPPSEHVDLIIIAVKAGHIPTAAAQAAELCRQSTGASLVAPGHAHHNDMKTIHIGRYADAGQSDLSMDDLQQLAARWRDAGFDVAAVEDISAMQ